MCKFCFSSRCKTAFQQDSFPCVKRAPSRQQSSKSDRTGLKSETPTPYRLPRLSVSQPSLGLTQERYENHDRFKIRYGYIMQLPPRENSDDLYAILN